MKKVKSLLMLTCCGDIGTEAVWTALANITMAKNKTGWRFTHCGSCGSMLYDSEDERRCPTTFINAPSFREYKEHSS